MVVLVLVLEYWLARVLLKSSYGRRGTFRLNWLAPLQVLLGFESSSVSVDVSVGERYRVHDPLLVFEVDFWALFCCFSGFIVLVTAMLLDSDRGRRILL